MMRGMYKRSNMWVVCHEIDRSLSSEYAVYLVYYFFANGISPKDHSSSTLLLQRDYNFAKPASVRLNSCPFHSALLENACLAEGSTFRSNIYHTKLLQRHPSWPWCSYSPSYIPSRLLSQPFAILSRLLILSPKLQQDARCSFSWGILMRKTHYHKHTIRCQEHCGLCRRRWRGRNNNRKLTMCFNSRQQ